MWHHNKCVVYLKKLRKVRMMLTITIFYCEAVRLDTKSKHSGDTVLPYCVTNKYVNADNY
jgi:hypothetical protein